MDEYDILITEQAESDLDELISFIQNQWPERVKIDFLATMSEKMQLLITMPYL